MKNKKNKNRKKLKKKYSLKNYDLISIITIIFFLVYIIKLKLDVRKFQNKKNSDIDNKNKEELLQMCYNSRNFYYIDWRKKIMNNNNINISLIYKK